MIKRDSGLGNKKLPLLMAARSESEERVLLPGDVARVITVAPSLTDFSVFPMNG